MSTNRPDEEWELPETPEQEAARILTPSVSKEQQERNRIASWLLCEGFENRFDPDLSAYLGRLAAAVRQGVDPSVPLAEMASGETS